MRAMESDSSNKQNDILELNSIKIDWSLKHEDGSKENLSSYENICLQNFSGVPKPVDERTAGPLQRGQPNDLGPHNCESSHHRSQHQQKCSKIDITRGLNRSKSLSISSNIDDLTVSLDNSRRRHIGCELAGGDLRVDRETFVNLQGNLNALDKTIKKCYLQLNKKVKRETNSNYVPSTAKISSKSTLRAEKVIVFIRVVFLKIGEIDTMKENFAADAFIQARWREPALDGMMFRNPDDIDWSKFWNPKIYIENSYTDPKETIWQALSFNKGQEATVFERRRIRGSFIENLELDEFPFDTQDLTLTITTERSEAELELEEDTDEISSINVQSFVDEQEWKLHSHVETWKKITTKAYQNSKAKHPSFSTSCRATRRPGFFIWNIFLVMLFICSLTFATFCVDLMKPENRLQLSFILLLTTITFKFVVSQTLPRISYLTYLDKYILISMAILCGVCVWHALVFSFLRHDLELAKIIDRWALIISGSSYFLFHVFFFSTIYLVALKKRWKYDKKDKEHKERIKRLQRIQEGKHSAGRQPEGRS